MNHQNITIKSWFTSKLYLTFTLLFLLVFYSSAQSQNIESPADFSAPKHAVQELKATTYSEQTVLVISGKIRNEDTRKLSGFVVIYLKNQSNDVLGTIETELTSNPVMAPGELSEFEVSTDISGISGIKNVSVEFREKI